MLKYFCMYPFSAIDNISEFGIWINTKLTAQAIKTPNEIKAVTLLFLSAPCKTNKPVNKNTCIMVGKKIPKARIKNIILSAFIASAIIKTKSDTNNDTLFLPEKTKHNV